MNTKEFPEAIEMEKQLLSAMFIKEGIVVPEVSFNRYTAIAFFAHHKILARECLLLTVANSFLYYKSKID